LSGKRGVKLTDMPFQDVVAVSEGGLVLSFVVVVVVVEGLAD
jgi:hypothetical protein